VKINKQPLRPAALVATGLMLLAGTGCKSGSSSKQQTPDTTAQSNRATNPLERQLDGGTYCVQTISQGPPVAAPLHFSYKENESDGSGKDFEADLAAQTLDVDIRTRHPATDMDRELSKMAGPNSLVIRDGFAETDNKNHYTRDDAHGWVMGSNSMALGGTPWGVFIAKPTSTPVGTENIIGYDTIRYAVDTSHQTAIEKSGAAMGWGVADYNITGTAWVTKDTACILQYVIDLDETGKDGKASKTHYEGKVTKH
jgi:hypothetical protein